MEVVADLGKRVFGRFALEVAQLVNAAALNRSPPPHQLDGARNPRATRSSRQPFHAENDSPPHSSRASRCLYPSDRTPTTLSTGTLTTFPARRTRRAKPSR